VLTANDPWLFREAAADDPYLTPVLRTVLHDRVRGPGGDDVPAVVFRNVRIGDVVTLTSLRTDQGCVLGDFIEEVLESGMELTDDQRAAMHAGARGIVYKLTSHDVEVRMGQPSLDVIVVSWDAVTAVQPAAHVVAPLVRTPLPPSPGDYVFVAADAQAKCKEAGLEWHSDMATMAGRWVPVASKHGAVFTAQTTYLKHAFPTTCVVETVRDSAVLEAIQAVAT